MKRFVFCGSFRAARMTSSISHWRSNCARDCPIEWLLKVEASETEGELLMAWIVGSFLNLRGVIYQMSKHCQKPVLCCPLGYNNDANGVVSDEFQYGCSYKTKVSDEFQYGCFHKTKMWKCIYFMRFPTEIKSTHCNAIWVWHPRDIFVYLNIETSGTQINLWIKLKLVTHEL